jgi:hypothetical protein
LQSNFQIFYTKNYIEFFNSICGIINETITAPSIDILYFQMLRKWQQFVVRTTLTGKNYIINKLLCDLLFVGLPFAAFIEAFFLLSQRKFPNDHNLLDSVHHLINISTRHLNPPSQTPTSPSNQHLPRTIKNTTNTANSSLNIRPNISIVRSSTTATIHRSGIIPSTAPLPLPPPSTNIDDKSKSKISRQSTKSVFPLFFDVL